MFKQGHRAYPKPSNTTVLVKTMLIRADQLLRVALQKDCSIEDAYQALGMAHELLDDADKLLCEHHYDQIPEGARRKTFEELTAKPKKAIAAKAATAGAGQ